jgi:beta-glucosidase
MDDGSLYGYVTKGQSKPLPGQLSVRYKSNNPRVVRVDHNGQLSTVDSGVATVTATVSYRGSSASTSFVVDVAPLAITSNPAASFTAGGAGSYTVTTSTTQSPIAAEVPRLTEEGTLPAGLTFTDNGDGTATIAGTPAANAAGMYAITIVAHNQVSPDARQQLTVSVGST